jgi:hypothetical protein
MVDPISNAPSSRQIGPTQRRSRASSDPSAEITSDAARCVEALRAAIEKLIKNNPTKDSRFASLSDEEGGAGSSDAVADSGAAQWPKLHHYLKQMEGLLLHPEA